MQSSKQKLLGHHSTDCELTAFNNGSFTFEQKELLRLQDIILIVHKVNSAMHIAQHGLGNVKRSKCITVRVEHAKSTIENKSIRKQKCATENTVYVHSHINKTNINIR